MSKKCQFLPETFRQVPSDQINLYLFLLFCFCKVLQENQIPGDLQLVKALTAVLTASQRFMREQEVV